LDLTFKRARSASLAAISTAGRSSQRARRSPIRPRSRGRRKARFVMPAKADVAI